MTNNSEAEKPSEINEQLNKRQNEQEDDNELEELTITIKPTDQLTKMRGFDVRLWEGETSRGTPCKVYIHRIDAYDATEEMLNNELRDKLPAASHVEMNDLWY